MIDIDAFVEQIARKEYETCVGDPLWEDATYSVRVMYQASVRRMITYGFELLSCWWLANHSTQKH